MNMTEKHHYHNPMSHYHHTPTSKKTSANALHRSPHCGQRNEMPTSYHTSENVPTPDGAMTVSGAPQMRRIQYNTFESPSRVKEKRRLVRRLPVNSSLNSALLEGRRPGVGYCASHTGDGGVPGEGPSVN